MKKPVLEVIRFDEADIVTASGLGGLGINLAGFGDEENGNGTFTFFGRSSGDEPHNAHETNIVSAFNSYFGGSWGSTGGIPVYGSYGGEPWSDSVEAMIRGDRNDDIFGDPLNPKKIQRHVYSFF